jgi:hypothetical protein
MFLPFAYSVGWATGVVATDPIVVSGIKASDIVLAMIKWAPGAAAAAVDPSTFVVTDNAIESATIDTSAHRVCVIWTRP